jgi:hypothetical protein
MPRSEIRIGGVAGESPERPTYNAGTARPRRCVETIALSVSDTPGERIKKALRFGQRESCPYFVDRNAAAFALAKHLERVDMNELELGPYRR